MGNLSKNFSSHEFDCKCGRPDCLYGPEVDHPDVDQYLIYILQTVRDHFGMPVHITSGWRCRVHNKAVGGVKNSQHLLGRAADIWIGHASSLQLASTVIAAYVADILNRHKRGGGLGVYATFVHIDVRPSVARWGLRWKELCS